MVKKGPRIIQLDGVRALAVSAVFIQHVYFTRILWMGVDLFFILSGFLITGVLLDSKQQTIGRYFAHFYERRARRILPPYILLLVIVSAVHGVQSWGSHWYFYLFLMNVVLARQISFPGVLIILWSLAVEEQFYFVWPFVIRLFSERIVGWPPDLC